jgi:hypothetical protein
VISHVHDVVAKVGRMPDPGLPVRGAAYRAQEGDTEAERMRGQAFS